MFTLVELTTGLRTPLRTEDPNGHTAAAVLRQGVAADLDKGPEGDVANGRIFGCSGKSTGNVIHKRLSVGIRPPMGRWRVSLLSSALRSLGWGDELCWVAGGPVFT